MVRPIALLQSTAMVLSLACMGVGTTSAVSGTIVGRCTTSVPNGSLSFGTYNPAAFSATEVSGTIALTCTKGDSVVITLSLGSNSASVPSFACATANCTRAMKDSGSDYLAYDIYLPTQAAKSAPVCAYSTVWNTSNSFTWTPQSKATFNVPVCGYVPINQYVATASYSDSVVVTVVY